MAALSLFLILPILLCMMSIGTLVYAAGAILASAALPCFVACWAFCLIALIDVIRTVYKAVNEHTPVTKELVKPISVRVIIYIVFATIFFVAGLFIAGLVIVAMFNV